MTTTTIFAAKEAKNNFGRLLDTALRTPVTIQKNGRSVAIMLSFEEYERLEALDDAYWGARAKKAMKEGFIGTRATKKYIESVLGAHTA